MTVLGFKYIYIAVVINDYHLREGHCIHPFISELDDSHTGHMLAMAPYSLYIINRKINFYSHVKKTPDGTIMTNLDKNRLVETLPRSRKLPYDRLNKNTTMRFLVN